MPGRIGFPAKLPASALDAATPGGFGLADGMLSPLSLPAELRAPETASNLKSDDKGSVGVAAPLPPRKSEQGWAAPGGCANGTAGVVGSSAAESSAATAYELTAVVVHGGGPESGHYTTYRRITQVCKSAASTRFESCMAITNMRVCSADVHGAVRVV